MTPPPHTHVCTPSHACASECIGATGRKRSLHTLGTAEEEGSSRAGLMSALQEGEEEDEDGEEEGAPCAQRARLSDAGAQLGAVLYCTASVCFIPPCSLPPPPAATWEAYLPRALCHAATIQGMIAHPLCTPCHPRFTTRIHTCMHRHHNTQGHVLPHTMTHNDMYCHMQ